MSIRYKTVKQVSGSDKTGTGKYAVKTVTGETLTFDNVCTQVTRVCGAHRETVPRAIGGLFDVMANHLDRGHSVRSGESGTLRPGLRTRAQDSEKIAHAAAVSRCEIHFTPGSMFKNFLKDVPVSHPDEPNSKEDGIESES